jgi:predicted metalloprotease
MAPAPCGCASKTWANGLPGAILVMSRCAVDRCAPNQTAICWPNRDLFHTNPELYGQRNVRREPPTDSGNRNSGQNSAGHNDANHRRTPGAVVQPKTDCFRPTNPPQLYNELDAFWHRELTRRGLPYRSPRWGGATNNVRFAAYQRWNETIFYNPQDYDIFAFSDGKEIIVLWLAHEFGHHIQQLLGSTNRKMLEELTSDELAGLFVRFLHDRNCPAARGNTQDLTRLKTHIEETMIDNSSPTDPAAHGRTDQRWNAFLYGYENGADVLRRLLMLTPRRP